MRCCAISDLHGHLPKIEECEILFIAGDICPIGCHGTEDWFKTPVLPTSACKPYCHSVDCQAVWLENHFTPWLELVPAKRIIAIAGNHDIVFSTTYKTNWRLDYLNQNMITINNAAIYGTPWHKIHGRWPFMAVEEVLTFLYAEIPYDLDVLIAHGPPQGILDDGHGSTALRNAIEEKQPRFVIYGHIHGFNGIQKYGTSICMNASLFDKGDHTNMLPVHNPIYFEV